MSRSKDKGTVENNNTNPIAEVLDVIESEGAMALFSGIVPRATRAIASGAIQFASYELTQNALQRR